MRPVFHVSTPENVRVVAAKVRNPLGDATVETDAIGIVLDRGDAVARLHRDSKLVDDLRELGAEGVALKACSNAAEHPDVSRSDLLDGVEVVPSGVSEFTRLQANGYAYIRL
ncbi:hypothetical protein BRC82_02500 [Halobacteriales archaeon QS_1_67_19]|nr:MAG: hypothetical protein BRC82_02500 [Halobacteriales archaeon QS_1_67_19]